MNKLIYVALYLILPIIGYGQNSTKNKPSWMTELPVSQNFDYYIGFGESDSLSLAEKQAVNDVLTQISRQIKSTYKVDNVSHTTIENNLENGKVTTETTFNFEGRVAETGEIVTVKGVRKVENYWEKSGNYKCWVLIRKPKSSEVSDYPLFNYDKSGVWRSAVFSGWGQLYEQKKGKGYVLLMTQSVSLAGLFTSQAMYSHNINNANKDRDNRDIYLSNADSWKTIRNISGIVAGTVYVVNLIDILGSKGLKQYALFDNEKLDLSANYTFRQPQIFITFKF